MCLICNLISFLFLLYLQNEIFEYKVVIIICRSKLYIFDNEFINHDVISDYCFLIVRLYILYICMYYMGTKIICYPSLFSGYLRSKCLKYQ